MSSNACDLQPCVFFDRDGVVNVSPGDGYVLRREDFHLQSGILDCLRLVRERGFVSVLVTSQRCVGKGLLSEAELDQIHADLQNALRKEGVEFHDILVFTGLPGTEHWEKPSPTMIEVAAQRHGLDIARSWIIGDADRDIEMGQRAGVGHSIRLRGEKEVTVKAEFETDSIVEVLAILRSHLR